MFLATTADQRFWKTDEKCLFLGEWCKAYDQKNVWSKLDHEVLPYHWEDQGRFNQDYQYLDDLYEKTLLILAPQLNQLHGVDHSPRYWRIVLGPWLVLFIQTFYDRYRTVCEAFKSGKATHTWVPSLGLNTCVPKDFVTFQNWAGQDSYNLVMYGWLLRQLKQIPFEIKNNISDIPLLKTAFSERFSKKRRQILEKFLEGYSRCVPDRFNQIVFISSTLEPWPLIRLQLSLGQFPYPMRHLAIKPREGPVDVELRKELDLTFAKTSFETLLEKIIPLQIPQVYIEGYHDMHRQSLKIFPKNPKVIVTSTGLFSNDSFKFWAGWQVDQGAKLVISQHGGGYGVSRIYSTEKIEVSCCDRYFSWGWNEPSLAKVTPMPSSKLAEASQSLRPDPQGPILMVSNEFSPYLFWMLSCPSGPKITKYLEDQELFYKEVSPEVRNLLLLRLNIADYGRSSMERWKKLNPNLSVYRGGELMYRQLNRSRLYIGTDSFTSHLEVLAANFPALFFWRPELFELRESAQPVYKELLEVGIFHDTPQSAAAKVNEIYHDPLTWWFTPEIQRVRERFCRQFAWTTKTWRSDWKNELVKISES